MGCHAAFESDFIAFHGFELEAFVLDEGGVLWNVIGEAEPAVIGELWIA